MSRMEYQRLTVKQIVRKIGMTALCKRLRVGKDAPRVWYSRGIPARHWMTLVKHYDWLSFDVLADATTLAQRPPTRRAA